MSNHTPSKPLNIQDLTDLEQRVLRFVQRFAETEGTLVDFLCDNKLHLSGEKARETVRGLVKKGWLQRVTREYLTEIRGMLKKEGINRPVFSYPNLGALDLTPDAARTIRAMEASSSPTVNCQDCFVQLESATELWYFPSIQLAQQAITETLGSEIKVVRGPKHVGPWRPRWWKLYHEGFSVAVTIPEDSQDESALSGGDLIRHHHLTEPLWACLEAVGSGPCNPEVFHRVALVMSQLYSQKELTFSDIDTAYMNCLRQGLLTIATSETIQTIKTRIAESPAIGPLAPIPEPGEVDFTPSGGELFWTIDKKLKGREWYVEHPGIDISVQRRLFSQDPQQLKEPIARYSQLYEAKQSSDPFQIGPWCVSWWSRRFPTGWCVDLVSDGGGVNPLNPVEG